MNASRPPIGSGGHRVACDHQPFFCEENIWRLCRQLAGSAETLVALVSSSSGCVRVRHQRAAQGSHVDWDYHVLLLRKAPADPWMAWDLDSTLGAPVHADEYLEFAFAEPVPQRLRPRFRVMSGPDYERTLSSDRSHMRRADGGWLHPPPPWPAPLQGEPNLSALIDMSREEPGEVVDLEGLRARLAR